MWIQYSPYINTIHDTEMYHAIHALGSQASLRPTVSTEREKPDFLSLFARGVDVETNVEVWGM